MTNAAITMVDLQALFSSTNTFCRSSNSASTSFAQFQPLNPSAREDVVVEEPSPMCHECRSPIHDKVNGQGIKSHPLWPQGAVTSGSVLRSATVVQRPVHKRHIAQSSIVIKTAPITRGQPLRSTATTQKVTCVIATTLALQSSRGRNLHQTLLSCETVIRTSMSSFNPVCLRRNTQSVTGRTRSPN